MMSGMNGVITAKFIHPHHSKERMLAAGLDAELPARIHKQLVHLLGSVQKASGYCRAALRDEFVGTNGADRRNAIRHIAKADRLHTQQEFQQIAPVRWHLADLQLPAYRF